MHTYIHTYIYTYIHTYLLTYTHTHKHTRLYTDPHPATMRLHWPPNSVFQPPTLPDLYLLVMKKKRDLCLESVCLLSFFLPGLSPLFFTDKRYFVLNRKPMAHALAQRRPTPFQRLLAVAKVWSEAWAGLGACICLCMYVCCVCCVCMYACTCMYAYMICMHVCMYACICVCVCPCKSLEYSVTCSCSCMCVHEYMYICTHACVYACMHVLNWTFRKSSPQQTDMPTSCVIMYSTYSTKHVQRYATTVPAQTYNILRDYIRDYIRHNCARTDVQHLAWLYTWLYTPQLCPHRRTTSCVIIYVIIYATTVPAQTYNILRDYILHLQHTGAIHRHPT